MHLIRRLNNNCVCKDAVVTAIIYKFICIKYTIIRDQYCNLNYITMYVLDRICNNLVQIKIL